MNATAEKGVIVFDNLVRPTEVVGEFDMVKAKKSKPFKNSNAAGDTRRISCLEDVEKSALESGNRLKQAFGS
ncbi:MAG TPA: hypothetical protein ENI80_10070 [Acidiferrobacteraceae bacterium]|nr:hypothetical protein [Acidiferrobacteraceae bacterium]